MLSNKRELGGKKTQWDGAFIPIPRERKSEKQSVWKKKENKRILGRQGQLAVSQCRVVPSGPCRRDLGVCFQMMDFGLWTQEEGAHMRQGSSHSQ